MIDALRARARAHGLLDVADTVLDGGRTTSDQALALFACPDLPLVGGLANVVRERLHGDVSWFNRNQHINATNVCEATCIFCSFSRLKTGDPAAYTMSMEEAVGRVKALSGTFVTEVHIVNGLNPDLPFSYYPDLLRALKAERPDLHIKGFTAVEIHYYAQKYGMTVDEVLLGLRAAGLDSLPGGGAEIFADRARRKLCDDKVDADGWLHIHRRAHALGFRTNATMLFGSIETTEERIDHLDRLRALQDETGGFQTFIPLKFHNENNRLRNVAETTPLDCLKTLAISRIHLDNFPHVKAYWPMMGMAVAQLSQAFGVSDLDGTVKEERIYHMAGATTPQELTRTELVGLVERADRLALERDTLYHVAAPTPALLATDGPAPRTRIASVGYLNARPLTDALDRDRHDVIDAVPSEVAERLLEGDVDVALVPVAALLSDDPETWRVVPGMAIGADGPVESVLLVAETEPERWTEVLLDGESRTSAVLAQLLLARGPLADRVGRLDVRTVGRGEAPALAGGTRAALVIGDAARALDPRFTVRLDLAALWREWTGLPFVFAVWAGRPDLDPRIGGELREAARIGRAAIPTRYDGADRTYLAERLRYELDDRALMGLRRFAALGRQAGFFAAGELSLLGPASTVRPRRSDAVEDLPFAELLQAAAARHEAPRVVPWALEADGASDLPDEVTRVRPPVGPQTDLRTLAGRFPGRTLVLPLAAVLRAGLRPSEVPGLGALDLDDGGPLLPDPTREDAVRDALSAGIEVIGAACFGRGETVDARRAHLDGLAALGLRSVVLRVTPWRGPGTEGHGTSADWLRAACWIRLTTDLQVVVPHGIEGLAVLQVALQTCASGVTPLVHGPDWEARAWALDRAIRDAGCEPERVGMETPSASGRRVARRPVHAPTPTHVRPDVR